MELPDRVGGPPAEVPNHAWEDSNIFAWKMEREDSFYNPRISDSATGSEMRCVSLK